MIIVICVHRLAEATTEIANSTAMRQAAGRVDHPVNAYHLLKVWHDLLVELPDPPADGELTEYNPLEIHPLNSKGMK